MFKKEGNMQKIHNPSHHELVRPIVGKKIVTSKYVGSTPYLLQESWNKIWKPTIS